MKIYFFGTKTDKRRQNDNYEIIIKALKQADIDLYTNLRERPLPQDLLALRESGGLVLDEMEAFVIDGTEKSSEIGYLMAYAISQKKPALYIYEKGAGSQTVLKYLTLKNIPKNLEVKNYQKSTLEKIILDFLKTLKAQDIKEIPRIKFTLRITSSIEKYLHYKTHNTKKSKADFLREYIEKIMKLDDDYQKFIKKSRE